MASDRFDIALTLQHMQCCGIVELHGIDGDEYEFTGSIKRQKRAAVLQELKYAYDDNKAPFLVFTSTAGNGTRLKRILEETKIGTVVTLPAKTNPNSGNKLKAYLAAIDHKKLGAYFAKHVDKSDKLW